MHTTFRPEQCHPTTFIAPTATVLGNVMIGGNSSVWYGAVVRGDSERIEIGFGSNVQDGCILHADPGFPCVIGNHVTLGHGAIVHGATIEDHVMIGMRAVIMNGAKIGRGSLIAVGAIVLEGVEIPPRSVVMGAPGKVKREVTERDTERILHAAKHYIQAATAFREAGAMARDSGSDPVMNQASPIHGNDVMQWIQEQNSQQ